MVRFVLLLLLSVVVARALWRLVDGIVEGMGGPGHRGDWRGVPQHGVQMARDPICGTFVIPDRAFSLSDGPAQVFFCSRSCRDEYRARTA